MFSAVCCSQLLDHHLYLSSSLTILDIWDSSSLQLWQRFYCLLAAYVIPNAGKVNSQPFRNQYKRIDVARVFREHYRALHRVFMHYVSLRGTKISRSLGSGSSQLSAAAAALQSTSITISEFQTFLRDLGLLSSKLGLDTSAVFALFSNIQQDAEPQSSPDNPIANASRAAHETVSQFLSKRGNVGGNSCTLCIC